MSQALIASAVRRGVVAETIAIGDLVGGQRRAFVHVHSLALFTLVAGPVAPTVETVPETLIFDLSRLSVARVEYNRIVDGSTMLLTAAQAVNGSGDKALVGGVLNDLADMVAAQGGGIDFGSITTSFCEKLDTAGLLTDPTARAKLLCALSTTIGNPSNAVRGLV